MLTYDFSELGKDSLYQYLYKNIKKDICSGTLSAGTKLPSKRKLSEHLSLSTITVENAYQQLAADGYIYSIPKKGYYVSDRSHQKKVIAADPGPNEPKLPSNEDTYYYDFVTNQTRAENFPFQLWSRFMREILMEKGQELMQNPPGEGTVYLRRAIADYLKKSRRMNVHHDQIIIGAGTEYLYSILIQLLGRSSLYAVEDPGYQKLQKVYESNQVRCCPVPMDSSGIRPEFLNFYGVQIAHISPNHHYPTGIIMPISRRYELLAWASQREDRYLIEDDYDSEFRMLGEPLPTLQSIDASGKVIYMNTFTKSLSSTIRIAYMVLPEALMQRYREKLGFYSCTVSNFEQYTLARIIEEGYYEKHILSMRNYYRALRDGLMSCILSSPLAEKAVIQEADSGLHFLLILNTELSDAQLIRTAAENRIRISCLSEYYQNQTDSRPHTLIMNYSALPQNKIQNAVDKLNACFC